MKIRTFLGLVGYVENCVNEFLETVEPISIQSHVTGRESITVVVVYKEVSADGR